MEIRYVGENNFKEKVFFSRVLKTGHLYQVKDELAKDLIKGKSWEDPNPAPKEEAKAAPAKPKRFKKEVN